MNRPGPKPRCACGKKDCRVCYNRTKQMERRARLKRHKPIARRTPIAKKRAKPRRVSVLRDPAYRAWLRERVCVACRSEFRHAEPETFPAARLLRIIDPAHTENNGRSSKGPDSSCIPLCRTHHRQQHNIGWPAFENHYGIDRARESAALYLAYTIWKESKA